MERLSSFRLTIIFAISIFLLAFASYFTTPLTIEDSNPSTYLIVPLLMLPIFAFLTVKERVEPNYGSHDLLLSTLLFLAFLALTFYLRLLLSFLFISFGVYLLIYPLAIASFAILLFGSRNIEKFKWLMLYAVFASPSLMVYVLNQNMLFAQVNSYIVYLLLHMTNGLIRYLPPFYLENSIREISIGQTCVSLGIFLALLFFLLPLSYLYNASKARKLLWLVSGIALLFVLNLARMAGISYYWLVYGPNTTVLFIHEFVGSFLFYITIIAMLLLAGKFGLSIRPQRPRRRTSRGKGMPYYWLISLSFGVIILLLSLNYLTTQYFPATVLAKKATFNFSNATIGKAISIKLYSEGYKNLYFSFNEGTALFAWNSSINASNPILIYIAPSSLLPSKLLSNASIISSLYFLNTKGSTGKVFDVFYNRSEFFLYAIKTPFILANNSSVMANAYVILPSYLVHNQTCSNYDIVYTYLYNAFNGAIYNATEREKLFAAYCIASGFAG